MLQSEESADISLGKKNIIHQILDILQRIESKFSPRNIAILYVLIYCMIYTLLGILTKLCQEIPPYQLTYTRSVTEIILSIIVLIEFKGTLISKDAEVTKLLILRGMLGGMGQVMFFHALYYIPISIHTVLFMLTPLWIGIVSSIKEREIKFWNFVFMAISFFAMFLILKPEFIFQRKNNEEKGNWNLFIGACLSIGTSMITGVVFFTIKNLKGKIQISAIVCYLNIFNSIISGFGENFEGVINLTNNHYIILFIMGVTGWIAQMVRSRALTMEKVFFISILLYSQIVFAYIADIFILGNNIDFLSNIGCLLIGLSMIGLIYVENKEKETA